MMKVVEDRRLDLPERVPLTSVPRTLQGTPARSAGTTEWHREGGVMKGTIVVVAMVATLIGVRAVEAQVIKNGALSGVVVSKSIVLEQPSAVAIYTTPPAGKGVFVLTQFCRSNCPDLSGSTLGKIGDNGLGCTSYSPGIAFPPGETLTCTNTGCGFSVPCTITGVVTKK
jgi:hypothetical protein